MKPRLAEKSGEAVSEAAMEEVNEQAEDLGQRL